jgi:uroporphyrin-III C-methyltransferase / precorrin-2 dehydrogenase / sirohydrochlorin ferrochelatase
MNYYPVFLDLAEQRCVVLGGGDLAAEKAAGLVEAGARVDVFSASLCSQLEEMAQVGRLEAVRRDYEPGDLAGARLVIDASGDTEINRRSWQEAETAGILINVVDRPAQCRFIAPAIVRRDPLLIAISTSGESPFLASTLRAWIERWIGAEWGPFTTLVGRVRRKLREERVPLVEQTRIFRRLLASDARALLRDGRTSEAAARAAAIAQPGVSRVGRVALVGAGPGDPNLLTVGAREALATADFVLHDALVSRDVLALCAPYAEIEDVGKRAGRTSARQEDITARLIELARDGHFVVRLKGGDPFVFGRGGEELAELARAGIETMVVPGVSAALAAPAAAGIPLTMRGVSSSLAITTAQSGDSLNRLFEIAETCDTLVVMMVRSNLAAVAEVVMRAVGPSRPAAVISNASLPEQKQVSGPLARIAVLADEAGIDSPATLVVGEVVNHSPALRSIAGGVQHGTRLRAEQATNSL